MRNKKYVEWTWNLFDGQEPSDEDVDSLAESIKRDTIKNVFRELEKIKGWVSINNIRIKKEQQPIIFNPEEYQKLKARLLPILKDRVSDEVK